MGAIFTDKEQNSISLKNVNYYDSKAEYMAGTFSDVVEDTGEREFNNQMEHGFIQNITCGTYNGVTDVFTPWKLTNMNILDTILIALREEEFFEFVEVYNDEAYNLAELEQWSDADWIREYTEVYEVFIIDGRVYVNKD